MIKIKLLAIIFVLFALSAASCGSQPISNKSPDDFSIDGDVEDSSIDKKEEYFTVTFISNGESIEKRVLSGDTVTFPIIERKGYVFIAWYYESDFITRFNAETIIVRDITLYALWERAYGELV